MGGRAFRSHAANHFSFPLNRWMRILVGYILLIALVVTPVSAVHITKNTFFAQWTMDSNGQVFPTDPRNTFNLSDNWICSYVNIENAQSPSSITWKWYSPSGIYYLVDDNYVNWSGNGVVWVIEPVSLFRFEPGMWRLDLEYNGALELSDTLNIEKDLAYPKGIENPMAASSNLHIYHNFLFSQFTIQQEFINPTVPLTKFTDTDRWVVSYVLLKEMRPGDTVTWEWYTPRNTLAHTNTEQVDFRGTGYAENHLVVGQFLTELGTWQLVLRYNGQEEASRSFSVQAGPPSPASALPTSIASPTTSIQQSLDQGGSFLLPGLVGAGILIMCIAGAVIVRKRQTHKGVPSQPPIKIAPPSTPIRSIHHDVFICYSTNDKPIADAICARLEAKGIRCWIAPRDVLPGLPYHQALITAIDTSRILVIVFSSSANDSPHVLRELSRAIDKNVIIIPFRIEDVQPSDALAYILSVPHWLDAITPPLEKHIEELGDTIMILLENERRKRKTD